LLPIKQRYKEASNQKPEVNLRLTFQAEECPESVKAVIEKEMLSLLHHYIWLQLGMPSISDIGRKFAAEIDSSKLVHKFVTLQQNISIE